MKLGKEESTETTEDTVEFKNTEESEKNSNTLNNDDTKQPVQDVAKSETANQPNQENKQSIDGIRRVIKVNEGESSNEVEKPADEEKPNVNGPKAFYGTQKSDSREELEQKRNMLQSIKDFDFQIKKNQQDINNLGEKVEGLIKDLDDLVSLYEIVSEQMNPFVGLSKVTKKRIDALENFTREIEDIKNRMGDVESIVEKGVGGIQRIKNNFENKSVNESKSELEEASDEISNNMGDLSDEDLDYILNISFQGLLIEQNIDNMINEFLLNLK